MEADVKEWITESGLIFLKDMGVKEGQVLLDLGCRVGHYAIPAAKVVGEKGKVYAADNDIASLNELMEIAKREDLKNIVTMHTHSAELKIDLEDESVDVILLYDVLHYMSTMERNKVYTESYRVLRNGALLSVYPKHNKSDEPLWNLSDMQLEDIIKEVESVKFNFEGRFHKKLIHDDNYNMGYILNFIKKVGEEVNVTEVNKWNKELEQERKEKDRFFATHWQSPIPVEKRPEFMGLSYHLIDRDFRFELELHVHSNKETIQIEDTEGNIRQFLRWGEFRFNVGGEQCTLQCYKSNPEEERFFIPIRDATSGKETYGAGRYLDIDSVNCTTGGKWILDFNKVYNPWCAYSENYACPFVPPENWLKVSIKAGEKNYPPNTEEE